MDNSLIQNDDDRKQIRNADAQIKLRRANELADIKFMLSSVQCRRFLLRLLSYCKLMGSIFALSEDIYYNSGQQDVGHFIVSEICSADEKGFLKMMEENLKEREDNK